MTLSTAVSELIGLGWGKAKKGYSLAFLLLQLGGALEDMYGGNMQWLQVSLTRACVLTYWLQSQIDLDDISDGGDVAPS